MVAIYSPGLGIFHLLRKQPQSCCLPVPPDIIHYPDPAIYDQALLFAGGVAPTFDSPDINTIDLWPIVPIDKCWES